MAEYVETIRQYAENVADATIVELKETLERDWQQLPFPGISQVDFLNRVLSCMMSEISSAEGTQLKGSEIMNEIKQGGKISTPGIIYDHAKHKLNVGNMVIFIYRKKQKVRLRVDAPWPAISSSKVIEVDCDNPKGCSAEVFLSVLEAFRDSYEHTCREYCRAMSFYVNSIIPIIRRLLELDNVTQTALQK